MNDKPVCVDFETEGIEDRPKYPPRPVGVAIWEQGKKPRYMAWGHPAKNNCSRDDAARVLRDLWKQPLLFHNAKFDLEVARQHFGLALPPWDRVHDTLFLLFFKDPHSPSLSLKPSAERYLKMPPEEQDAVRDWLVAHDVIAKNQGPGPHICKAPGDVVGRYAVGDVVRTRKLFDLLYPELDARQRVAYDRERRLMPILMDNERDGMSFDVPRAEKDLDVYGKAMESSEIWLRKRLKAKDLNLDADADVAEALDKNKIVTDWTWTKGGNGRAPQRSVAKANLGMEKFHDKEVYRVLGYRNRLQTVLSLNLRPWLATAQASGGKIYTDWRQVRQAMGGDETGGARTGRIACSRWMNVSKDFYDKSDGYEHPTKLAVPELPLVRKYLIADPGQMFVHLDYSQQEFRILAHYEDADLKAAYQHNPRIDYHEMMQARIKEITGEVYERRAVKTLNFGILYGMGGALLAARLRKPVEVAYRLRAAAKAAAPGVQDLDTELKRLGAAGEPIRTWGGRIYYCEPPRYVEKYKRVMDFGYKLLNYLIQGSAADCTKEAIIRYADVRRDGRMLVTVHDEINISVPRKAAKAEAKRLREAMESIEFDVPMLTDTEYGPSWGELKEDL